MRHKESRKSYKYIYGPVSLKVQVFMLQIIEKMHLQVEHVVAELSVVKNHLVQMMEYINGKELKQ